MDYSECSAGTILWTFVLTDCYKIVDASCVIFSLFPAQVLQAAHYMHENKYLPYRLLFGRATSKPAINFLGTSLSMHCNNRNCGTAIIEIPYLALTKKLPEVRDVGFDKVPGVGWSWG